ncbi:MAG: type II/IV secretion system ATPase subunit [Thermoplasmata archaeon]|nr:type II/IV secretion system ATPase subunit [Thermoplasmata archaeon]
MREEYSDGDIADRYSVDGVDVIVVSHKNRSSGSYLIYPPEYQMNPRQLQVLTEAMNRLSRFRPGEMQVESISIIRAHMRTMAKDVVYSILARQEGDSKGEELEREADELSTIICRYTAGYGVLETMLRDPRVQDVYIDAPSGQAPVHVVLRSNAVSAVRQKCRTNVFVGRRDLQAFVSRVKFETGLPFSEAVPVLEADIKDLRSRVTLVSPPLSDRGVSVAVRRHSERVWSLPHLIANSSLSPLLSGFLWACTIGRRAVLIAGSRGAGKTTLLSALLLEFPLSQRILLIEDTPEVPVARMQELGYDIQTLRFSHRDAAGRGLDAKDALKVSLRMGESAIVIGEVRSHEASVLYESMRAGSAGSSVLGTIHGNSAKGVLDRAVEDLGVSERAFSSTDIVVVIGLLRSPDGTRFSRRVVEVAEVRQEGSSVRLVNLFETDPECSCAKPTAAFSAGCDTVAGIADALGRSPEDLLDIIRAKAHADQVLADTRTGTGSRRLECTDDMRVRSNELLTRDLFNSASPEAGLRQWMASYETRFSGL